MASIAVALGVCFVPIGSTTSSVSEPVPSPTIPQEGAATLLKRLDPVDGSYPATTTETLNRLKQGIEAFQERRYEAALAAFPEDAAAQQTALPDYATYFRAEAELALSRPAEALRRFETISARYSTSPWRGPSITGEGKALLKLGDPEKALARFKSPLLETGSEVLYHRALAEEQAGRPAEAVSLYIRVWSDFVNSPRAAEAHQRIRALSPASISPAKNYPVLLRRAENLSDSGKSSEARSLLLQMRTAKAPDPSTGDRFHLLYGQEELNRSRNTAALQLLNRVGETVPEHHAHALYLKATAYRRLGREASLLDALEAALKRYPQSGWTARIQYSVATYYELKKDEKKAEAAYAGIARGPSEGEYAERARWKVALYAWTRAAYEEALARFWEYLRAIEDPDAKSAAAYWMGRCYDKLGDSARAEQLYRAVASAAGLSFYGQRAKEALPAKTAPPRSRPFDGIDFTKVMAAMQGIPPRQLSPLSPNRVILDIVERCRQLRAAGMNDFALKEAEWGLKRFPDEKSLSFVMSRLHEAEGDHLSAIVALRRAFPEYRSFSLGNLPEPIWRLLFPVRHWEIIRAESRKRKLEPSLVLAVIRQESAFNSTARSRANARGLMQVLPSTGRQLARSVGIPRYSTAILYQPKANITMGTHHLSSLLKQFDGRVELALAAYNAGDNRVAGWLRDFGGVDMEEFVERIPFRETRNYVKIVLENRAWYDQILPARRSDGEPGAWNR